MIQVGQAYELSVVKFLDFGAILDAGELGEVLLPNRHTPEDLLIGDLIKVFLYFDSEDRLVATTQIPKVQVGEFAYLNVIDRNQIGAFLDWGLDKDLLVPFAEQHVPMEEGHSYLVYVYRDKNDGRIVASAKIDKFIDDDEAHDFKPHEAVNLIIANTTELGYKAIIEHHYWGVLYENEVFQRLSFGQSIKGFIKRVRDDGKIDLTLQGGQVSRDKNATLILNYLSQNQGFANVHDKSAPKQIADLFGMSKGAFKKAIGGLYKQKVIRIEKDGIHLSQRQTYKKN
ncbi:CvfB family protein [sulfur-oxidizing endosymbiont of Gigantopelta aegis]|uniref:CvfB family protein n=1 Tax=sulfur-oxidizing endosymbiont of Gigantopelta aegis TaxID=2794934 RepID=UPI0018DC682B|nr:S1-like domain-containing RNA-binding protein [sulfur-oxidizing endosymbiont of Gigantopelta aegis]